MTCTPFSTLTSPKAPPQANSLPPKPKNGLDYRQSGDVNQTIKPTTYVKPNADIADLQKAYEDLQYNPNALGDFSSVIRFGYKNMNQLQNDSYAMTKKVMGRNSGNDESDAFRHAYMSYLAAQRFGTENAKAIGDGHESRPRAYYEKWGQNETIPAGVTLMDLHNNHIGRMLFEQNQTSNTPPKVIIKQALENGILQTRPFNVLTNK